MRVIFIDGNTINEVNDIFVPIKIFDFFSHELTSNSTPRSPPR